MGSERGGARRVAITGAGTVNALALDVAGTMAALAEGRVAIGPLHFDEVERLSVRIGGQIHIWDAEARFSRQELSLYDRVVQFAIEAAQQAVTQAGLDLSEAEAMRAGVVLGTGGGGYNTVDDSYRALHAQGRNRVHPFTIPRLMHNAAAAHLSMRHGLKGPSFTVSTACASSNHAMGLALQMVRSGASDVVLTGGAEATLCFGGLKAWEGLRVMSPDGCRPFCASRNGMVQGEGATVFVFEDWDRATARGAEILAEVAGAAMSSDAGDIVLPDPDGAARAMRGALADGGLNADDIGYINAHGTATAANDRSEAQAIRSVFDTPPPVSSTKSMHGHLLGAAGAVELLAVISALRDGVIPPTAGWREADPAVLGLDVVPNESRRALVDAALSNAFAFGGMNACLALRRA
ncbi:beta-ketoacyl-[acyl-carrier-protein] synthase family protein [Rhodobacter sp. NTK016B]|uniref:beta-ketoacyl-[acyl-carrier-protein] synthase family protein n=1 Tax=Rhodobacter sp. NTK016B TaxID=2759676 RepID=UPI001A8D3377|nr:beta-ketoacyl-[acyl-carrier-protein] synthase family protein [Rhodobacter sp. NTK016B]MBN8294454.1 beta-ketoacyl-[acyl-carrier-protein] synthase family protein [Rhodobacter sp. NTK016B]